MAHAQRSLTFGCARVDLVEDVQLTGVVSGSRTKEGDPRECRRTTSVDGSWNGRRRRLDDREWETDGLSKFRCGGGGEALATLTPRVVRARERR